MPRPRYLTDCPIEIERAALETARSIVGSGYVDDFYASVASEFMWLYRAGYREAMADTRKRAKGARAGAIRKKRAKPAGGKQ